MHTMGQTSLGVCLALLWFYSVSTKLCKEKTVNGKNILNLLICEYYFQLSLWVVNFAVITALVTQETIEESSVNASNGILEVTVK